MTIRTAWRGHGATAVALLLAAAAAAVVTSTVVMVVTCAVPAPILDQWAQLVAVRTVTPGWLVSQHNEHRLLFPRLVFVADRYLASETGAFSLAVNLVLQAALAGVLGWLGIASSLRNPALRLAVLATVAGLSFWSVQYENDTWPFQVQIFIVMLAAAGSLASVALIRRPVLSAAVAMALGFVATFSFASGVLVPPLAVALAAWLRRPGRVVLAMAVVAGLISIGFAAGYATPPGHAGPAGALWHPLALAAYTLVELGNPIGAALRQLDGQPHLAASAIAGGLGLALLLAVALRARRQPAAAALLALCGFVVAEALLTAAGRLELGLVSAMASRYATASLAFWCCLILLASVHVPLPRPLALACAASVLGLVGLTQPRFAAIARSLAADRTAGLPALAAGVADAALIAPLYPTPAEPLAVRPAERATRTGVFAWPWAQWLGTPLTDHVGLLPPQRCQGRFETATRIDAAAGPGWRVGGTVRAEGRPVIALTGPDGRIAGFGIGVQGGTVLGASGPDGQPTADAWVGALAGIDPAQAQAFLLSGEGTACPLAGVPRQDTPVVVGLAGPAPPGTPQGGAVDAVYLSDFASMDGWALTQTATGTPRLRIQTNLPVLDIKTAPVHRADVDAAMGDERLAQSGFHVTMQFDPSRPRPAEPFVCVWSEDAIYGTHRLASAPGSAGKGPLCPAR